jgi:uncharacterized integral membrane protein
MTDEITNQPVGAESKPDTYHDPKKLTQYADIANMISWLFLALFVISGGIIIYLVYYFYKNHATLEQFALNLPNFLVPFLVGGFAWVVLKLISEGVYLLMDIEDNTRRTK